MARILAVALALSLVLNGFLLGRMAGLPGAPDTAGGASESSIDHPGKGRRGDHRHDGDRAISHLVGDIDALPPEARETLHKGFQARRKSYLENRHREAELRDAFAAALASDPFDRAAAEAAISALYAGRADRELAMAKVLIDVFEELPAEKRAELIAESKERRARRIDRWRERRTRPDIDGAN